MATILAGLQRALMKSMRMSPAIYNNAYVDRSATIPGLLRVIKIHKDRQKPRAIAKRFHHIYAYYIIECIL